MSDCVFCAITTGAATKPRKFRAWAYRHGRWRPCRSNNALDGDANRLNEPWPDAVTFEPLGPVVPGHMLAVPTHHVTDARRRPELTGRLFELAAEHLAPVQFNLISSAGGYATQTVFHLHVHVVPRGPGDGLALPWTGQYEAEHTDGLAS